MSDQQTLDAIRENIVGKPVEEARELCKSHGWTLRCRNRNGKNVIGTCDLRMDRVNYTEVDGIVTEVNSIG